MVGKKKFSTRKKMMLSIVCILLVIVLLYGITLLIPLMDDEYQQTETEGVASYNFYPVDYDEDIYSDVEYMELISDGIITFDDNVSLISSVDIDNCHSYGKQVELLTQMIYSIIDGDVEEYNSFFSTKYFERNNKKQSFTKQKLYNVRITYFNSDTFIENGNVYEQYEYTLSYNIYKNNGTFRNDIGDGARIQYFTISNRDGKLLIDSIATPKYK